MSLALHRWHRRIGVAACLFIVWMAVSGWLLNHDDSLHLDRHQAHSAALLHWYGLPADLPTRAWPAGSHWLVDGDDALLLDGRPLAQPPLKIKGAEAFGNMLFVAGANTAGSPTLLLLTDNGELVDTLHADLLPLTAIERIGVGCNGVVIADGTRQFASTDGTTWAACQGSVAWSTAAPLTHAQRRRIGPLLLPGISYEKLLLDLHSGRFFGAWGPWFVDSIGAGMVVLAFSGLWMFSSQARHQRRRSHRTR